VGNNVRVFWSTLGMNSPFSVSKEEEREERKSQKENFRQCHGYHTAMRESM
jgi:predicted small metal-binding protein